MSTNLQLSSYTFRADTSSIGLVEELIENFKQYFQRFVRSCSSVLLGKTGPEVSIHNKSIEQNVEILNELNLN